jgi:hypothetical protein
MKYLASDTDSQWGQFLLRTISFALCISGAYIVLTCGLPSQVRWDIVINIDREWQENFFVYHFHVKRYLLLVPNNAIFFGHGRIISFFQLAYVELWVLVHFPSHIYTIFNIQTHHRRLVADKSRFFCSFPVHLICDSSDRWGRNIWRCSQPIEAMWARPWPPLPCFWLDRTPVLQLSLHLSTVVRIPSILVLILQRGR